MRNLMLPIAGVIVLTVIVAAAFLATKPEDPHLSPAMLNSSGADIGAPFELTAHTGQRTTSADVIDKPSLVYFGYTFCPDICPIDVQVMTDAVEILKASGVDIQPIFITIDPERDTPAELATYVEAMHPDMIALTGSQDDIRAAADAYKVFYDRVDTPGSAAEYLMQHTGYTYLMTSENDLAAIFRNGFPPEQIAADVEKVLQAN